MIIIGKLEDWWDKWSTFVDSAKDDPKTAIKTAALDNLQVVIPIIGIVAGIIILKMTRRGRN